MKLGGQALGTLLPREIGLLVHKAANRGQKIVCASTCPIMFPLRQEKRQCRLNLLITSAMP